MTKQKIADSRGLDDRLQCPDCGRDYEGDETLKPGDACPSDECPSREPETPVIFRAQKEAGEKA